MNATLTPVPVPLVVDLDGTLIRSDLLVESILALLRKRPFFVFLLPFWLLRGRARFKREIARRAVVDVSALPWRMELVDELKRQHAAGRTLVLATGSDMLLARPVADYLGLFDMVFASDGAVNLCGAAKGDLLVNRFGEKGFDYTADGGGITRRDRVVWASAHEAVRVQADTGTMADRMEALRPGHWLKNLLVFVPVFAAHRFTEIALLEKSLLAFAALCLCASSGYLFNDLIDLEADRHHPHKRLRPFASGRLPLTYGLIMMPVLLIAGCVLGALASPLFLVMAAGYFVMSGVYSLRLKKVALLDVLFLAGLYTMRIMAGSAATGIWSSHWLLAFSTFLFFSLALVKRYSELVVMRDVEGVRARARAYESSDGELLATMGTASGYLAVMVFALYIASDKAATLYTRPGLLWMLCPLLLYWISHVWLTAHRGKMHDDPVVFATSDRTSRILILLMLAAVLVAL
jgi:4-hydroxybenzoate polyprenyltransferase